VDAAELMRSIIAGFEQSDLRPLYAALHEDVVWKSASKHKGVMPPEGDYKGPAGVVDALSKISLNFTFHHFLAKEILLGGDTIWGHFEVEFSFDPKGKRIAPVPVNLEMAIRWRLKDGKIIEHQSYFDTASLLIQQGRKELPPQ